MKVAAAARIALLSLVAACGAYAQMSQSVQVNFAFNAGETKFEPGRYRLTFEGKPSSRFVILQGPKAQARLPIITLLARQDASARKVSLIFDEVQGTRYLSEVWVPNFDGMLVRGTKEEHKHHTVE